MILLFPAINFDVLGTHNSIYLYNLFIGIGVIIGLLIFQHLCKNNGFSNKQIDNILVLIAVSLLASFVGASLFDKIAHSEQVDFSLSPLSNFTGMTFYGGLLAGAICFTLLFFVLFKSTRKLYELLNCCAVSLAIGHCFGRIGCFFGGCCYGKPTDSWIGITFPINSLAGKLYARPIKLIPTQLIEATFLFILFLILYFYLSKNSFAWYLILYGLFRFVIEFYRGDNRGSFYFKFLSPSQIISLFIFIFGIVLYIVRLVHYRNLSKQ